MTHKDHVHLIKKAISGSVWADLGSGWGAFTLALRDIGGPELEIYSVDQNLSSINEQKQNFKERFPSSNIHFIHADFTKHLDIPKLDGILMANSLHYIKNQVDFLKNAKSYLKPTGKLVIVEYNLARPNPWVPYPINFDKFSKIIQETGFNSAEFLEKVPLEWGHEMYSAETLV